MNSTKLIIKTKSKSYPIYFGSDILKKTAKLIKENLPNVKKICIISDNKLPKLIIKNLIKSLTKYELKVYKLSAIEKTKSLKIANKIIEQLLKNNFNRSDCIITPPPKAIMQSDLLKLFFNSCSIILFAILRFLVFSFADNL